MKIIDVLEKVERLKPNTVDGEDKLEWINGLEGILYNNIFSKASDTTFTFSPYDYDEDQDTELMVQVPYDEIYFYYICAKIDFIEGEVNSYNNNMALYNALYDDFAAFYRREHIPKRGY